MEGLQDKTRQTLNITGEGVGGAKSIFFKAGISGTEPNINDYNVTHKSA